MFGMLVYGNDSRGSSMSRRFMFTAFFSIAVAIVSMNGQCENFQPRSSKFDSSYVELEIVPHHESQSKYGARRSVDRRSAAEGHRR